jgi:ElaB/YqjD/DUF883 family membrane-anchored ribosome-binding protein
MSSDTSINPTADKTLDFQAIATDIGALKRDLSTLLQTIRENAINDVAHAKGMVGHLGEEAMQGCHAVAAQGERAIKAVGHQVEERPLMSLALAFAVGFLGSRLLSR